ncbi:MAG: peptide deformylase, partial [Solirubrobacterales bacterium]
GKMIKVKGTGLLARAIQHEIDHLNGILFIDKLTDISTLRKVKPQEDDESTLRGPGDDAGDAAGTRRTEDQAVAI